MNRRSSPSPRRPSQHVVRERAKLREEHVEGASSVGDQRDHRDIRERENLRDKKITAAKLSRVESRDRLVSKGDVRAIGGYWHRGFSRAGGEAMADRIGASGAEVWNVTDPSFNPTPS